MNPGLVNYNGKIKPFEDPREIRRGKHAGQIEVVVRLMSKHGMVPRKRLVYPGQIRRYPE